MMKRTALVVGAEIGELTGVHNDVATVSALLAGRGFEVDARTGADATQAGIRDGYARLVDGVRDGDAVVVYFSGHGGLARVTAPDGIALPELQFIVPTDYDQSSPADFRGITAPELSVWLARLTRRTRNTTVILDCCHAAHMARNDDLRVRALLHPTYLDVAEHIGALRAQGLPVDDTDVDGNPDAVRLVACAPWESAYEYTNSGGDRAGILTDSLRIALGEAGNAPVSWSLLVQRIRTRVAVLALGQRPEVEGPSRRLPFDVAESASDLAFPVFRALPDRLSLPGAALLGVAPGDRFAIVPAGAGAATEESTVARATVQRTDGVTVQADFQLCDGHYDLPALLEAHPLATSATPHPVLVRGDGTLVERVRAAIAAIPTLRAVGPDDPAGNDPVLAEVRVTDTLALFDGGPEPLLSVPADDGGTGTIVTSLGRLGRAAGLRRLTPGPGEALTEPFTVAWGQVVQGGASPLPPSGAVVSVGDAIYLRLRNDSTRNLFFFVFDLGVAGAVRLVTAADPSGLRLCPGQEHVVGEQAGGALRGNALVWPPGVPTGAPRPETLLVIVATDPQDLSVLAHEGVEAATARGSSPLLRAVAAATGQATRDWPAPDEPTARYAVVRLDCQLSPVPTPVPETARFLVDERPDTSMRVWRPRALAARGIATPRGTATPPGTVAVRLTELVVHRNRALGGTDVRVDALVLTGGGGDLPVYRARTVRFSNVRDGDRLPLDNLLVYHGPAVDYLDLAWWVTRDRRDSRALADLLRERLSEPDVQHAVASLSGLAIGAPHAALAVAAVSACAIIVDTAYQLLSTVVGDSIGLYRTSLLAVEEFGVGRHPASGTQHAQDFSFAFEIVPTG